MNNNQPFFFHEISCILILNEALKVLFNVSEEQYYEIFNFIQENYLCQTCNDDNDANSCKTLCNVESDWLSINFTFGFYNVELEQVLIQPFRSI